MWLSLRVAHIAPSHPHNVAHAWHDPPLQEGLRVRRRQCPLYRVVLRRVPSALLAILLGGMHPDAHHPPEDLGKVKAVVLPARFLLVDPVYPRRGEELQPCTDPHPYPARGWDLRTLLSLLAGWGIGCYHELYRIPAVRTNRPLRKMPLRRATCVV